ncbi:MAG: Gfo/Idh/MocA family oxidoreductase [Caldilineaceae bacterium]|nr:Gfo/Idh/MocA family oxidoreductase [Caldilineaceae bacterium]
MRIGMFGAGRMAHIHAAHLRTLAPEARIVAACSRSGARAEEMAATWGGRAYTDYRRLLDENELDAAYICTPTSLHAEIGLACVARGLHLFVEKPLDMNLAAAHRLVEAAAAQGVIALTAFHWRYSQGFLRARELIGDDPVALVALRWYWTRPPIDWMWRRQEAGGQIVDQNIHLIDVSRALAGNVETVYAAYNSRQVNFEDDFDDWDGYAVTLRYERGAVGTCAGTYGLFPEIQLGPVADFAIRDRLVRVTDKGVLYYTPQGVEEWLNDEPFHLGVNRAFIEAVRTGDASAIDTTLYDGFRSTAVALAANYSAESGAPVTMNGFIAASINPEAAA